VSYYFLDTSTRHSILTKSKTFGDKPRLSSNSSKLTGWLTIGQAGKPVIIPAEDVDVPILREEDDDAPINLIDIPELPNANQDEGQANENDALFVQDSDESDPAARSKPGSKRRASEPQELNNAAEDKKKLGLKTFYDGFSIYGRVLCLVVRRRGQLISAAAASSQQLMENWISTQAASEGMMVDD
jgi:hypothetical protein